MAVRGVNAVRKAKPSEQAIAKLAAVLPGVEPEERESNARPIENFPELLDVLPGLVDEYLEIQAQAKELENRRKELSEEISPLLIAVDHNSIRGDGWNVIRSCQHRKTILAERLLAKGVSSEIIKACTRVNEVWQLSIRKDKEESE